MMTQIGTFFLNGGFWMYPIMLVQIVSMALIVERYYSLFIARSLNARDIVQTFEQDIKSTQMDKVLSKAQSSGHEAISTLTRVGIQSSLDHSGREELQLKFDEILIEESGRVDARLGFISMLANVATLLGLLGTIVGLIKSFTAISGASAADKARILAEGVGEAMSATAYGLIVAVPALIAFGVLQNRANTLTEDLNKAALRLFIWLGFNVEGLSTKRRSSK